MIRLNVTRNSLIDTFDNYKILQTRKTRSLMPFFGSLLNSLFGVSTDSQIKDVREAINNLGSNQDKIKHIVEKAITIVNHTEEQITENRKKLNEIISTTSTLVSDMELEQNYTRTAIHEIGYFIATYHRLSNIIEDLQETILRSDRYLNDLKTQLDMLSFNALTPSVIRPLQLRSMLRDIARLLPRNIYLPINPDKNLYKFYKTIKSTAAIQGNKIYTILDIPLLSLEDRMDIFQAHNLPIPYTNMFGENETIPIDYGHHMVAKYKLEADIFAIDKSKSRYVLLSKQEAIGCNTYGRGFCKLSSPVYYSNVSKFCVIVLFMMDVSKLQQYCNIIVEPNAILPNAKFIRNGMWIISTIIPINFNIQCHDGRDVKRTRTLTIVPPISELHLPAGCVATSGSIILPEFQEFTSKLKEKRAIVKTFFNEKHSVWKPMQNAIPDFNYKWNVSSLKNIEAIKVGELINKLKQINRVSVRQENGTDYKIIGIIALISLILLIVIMIIKNRVWLMARMTRDTEASQVSEERVCERHGEKDDDDPVKITEDTDTNTSNTIATRPVVAAKGLNYAPETMADPFILYPRV